MHRLLRTLVLAIFLVLMYAVWQPANATSFCNGLKCEQCEVDLNTALATGFIATPYTFVCGHDGGAYISLAFSGFPGGPPVIFADYDGFDSSCSVFVSATILPVTVPPTIDIDIDIPGMDRPSINAWKKVLREVCRNY